MAENKKLTPKRRDIFLVNFDPTIGSEISKTRPALILQNNVSNKYSPVTIVAAITSYGKGKKLYPTEVFLNSNKTGLDNDSVALLNQIRTIDKKRLVKKIGKIDENTMSKADKALEISLGIVEI